MKLPDLLTLFLVGALRFLISRIGAQLFPCRLLLVFYSLSALPQGAFSMPSAPNCAGAVEVPVSVLQRRIVVFGEIYGTNEAPEFVSDYVCLLSRSSKEILLGVEAPALEESNLLEFINGHGDANSRRKLLSGQHWKTLSPDGRTSIAMFSLIEQVRKLRVAGVDISIFAFDRCGIGQARGRAMGACIRDRIKSSPSASIVILVGNLHAMKQLGRPGAADFEPMVKTIADLRPISLNMSFKSGSAWMCRSAKSCGPVAVSGSWPLFKRSRGITLSGTSTSGMFDGEFFIGAITASPPAVSSLNTVD